MKRNPLKKQKPFKKHVFVVEQPDAFNVFYMIHMAKGYHETHGGRIFEAELVEITKKRSVTITKKQLKHLAWSAQHLIDSHDNPNNIRESTLQRVVNETMNKYHVSVFAASDCPCSDCVKARKNG